MPERVHSDDVRPAKCGVQATDNPGGCCPHEKIAARARSGMSAIVGFRYRCHLTAAGFDQERPVALTPERALILRTSPAARLLHLFQSTVEPVVPRPPTWR